MLATIIGPLSGLLLFLSMLIFLEFGRYLGKKQLKRNTDRVRSSITVTEGAVFGLMGLLIAFTFAGANTRFDQRRGLIIEEANAISNSYKYIGLLSEDIQPILKEDLRQYLNARLEFYKKIPDFDALNREMLLVNSIEAKIWREALTAATTEKNYPASVVLLPALTHMFDIANTRAAITLIHPPIVIFWLLVSLALFSALLAGFSMGGTKVHSSIHIIGFAAITAFTIYLTLDLEYPRIGLIRVDSFDEVLRDVQKEINN